VALVDVVNEAGVVGRPAEQSLDSGRGGGAIHANHRGQEAEVLDGGIGGEPAHRNVEVAADGLCDVLKRDALVADGVVAGAGEGIVEGEPVEPGRVECVHR
jgi:hypothetical protein